MLKFSKQVTFAIKQNLKGIENKKVLITSKLKKNFKKLSEILFQIRIRLKAKLLSSQGKVSRSQQKLFYCLNRIVAAAAAAAELN